MQKIIFFLFDFVWVFLGGHGGNWFGFVWFFLVVLFLFEGAFLVLFACFCVVC